MSETPRKLLGPFLGFINAEKPMNLSVLDLEQHMLAFLAWTAGQFEAEMPPLNSTTIFVEGSGAGLVHEPADASALYRCSAENFEAVMKRSHFAGTVVLFVGGSMFLHEAAQAMLRSMAPPPDKEYDDIRPMVREEAKRLAAQAASLLPGEVCRFAQLCLASRRFARLHMLPIMMSYLHHHRNFDGTEAATAALPPTQALYPTWPNSA